MKNATSQAQSVNVKCRVSNGNLEMPLSQLGKIANRALGTGGAATTKQRGRPAKAKSANTA